MAAPTPAEIAAAQAVIAAAVAPVVAAPAPSKTFGQALDADVAALSARVKALENKTVTWIGNNWLHVVNAGGIAATLAHAFGKL